jgi:peroxiredoxin
MMRKIIFYGCVLLLAACNREQVRISGHIANAGEMMLHLDEVDVYENRPADSVVLKKNGRFSFAIDTKIPSFYQLRLSDNQIIVLFPKPGQHIKIEADANNLPSSVVIEGSHETEQVTKLIVALRETKNQLDSVVVLYNKATEDSVKNRLNAAYQDIMDRHRKFSITFILTHYNSLASLYALYQQYEPGSYVFHRTTDMQFFKIVSDSLSKYIPGSRHVTALKAYTNNMISDYNSQVIMQKAEQTVTGLPDIALPDFEGDTVTLSSLKGRYVLLSFWASYNQTSVNQNLELKKIYNQYKNQGFEIFQVSFDNSLDTWKDAVRFDELPWISVIDSKFPNTALVGNYNVAQLPANYLISRDNESILAKNLTPAQLRMKLNDLFN